MLNHKEGENSEAVVEFKSMQLLFNFQIIVNCLIVMVWLKPVHLGLQNPYISLSDIRYGLVVIYILLKICTFKQELNNFTNRGYEYLKSLAIESTDVFYAKVRQSCSLIIKQVMLISYQNLFLILFPTLLLLVLFLKTYFPDY